MKVTGAALAACLLTAACQGVPTDALKLSEVSNERRQLQTRRYDTADEERMLIAIAHLLQDLGFHLEESDTGTGVIVGSKMRDAQELDQQVGAFILGALAQTYVPTDDEQEMRVSVVTRPIEEGTSIAVRVTFQRTVWNAVGDVTTKEGLFEPEYYQEFFRRLSHAVFLEEHEL